MVTAAGGLEGLKRAKELHPIAITLDVMMPDIDGWTVLAALRGDAELADIPVVMVTIVDEQPARHGARRRRISDQADRSRTLDRDAAAILRARLPTRVLVVEDDPTAARAGALLARAASNGR